jgi:hypothetical protein
MNMGIVIQKTLEKGYTYSLPELYRIILFQLLVSSLPIQPTYGFHSFNHSLIILTSIFCASATALGGKLFVV